MSIYQSTSGILKPWYDSSYFTFKILDIDNCKMCVPHPTQSTSDWRPCLGQPLSFPPSSLEEKPERFETRGFFVFIKKFSKLTLSSWHIKHSQLVAEMGWTLTEFGLLTKGPSPTPTYVLKIEQFSMIYETIDNDDYSENMLYSLNKNMLFHYFLVQGYKSEIEIATSI